LKVRRILITGGTGFVGSHLIRYLKSSDVKLTVVSSRDTFAQVAGIDY